LKDTPVCCVLCSFGPLRVDQTDSQVMERTQ
jgi:hypothetical protein